MLSCNETSQCASNAARCIGCSNLSRVLQLLEVFALLGAPSDVPRHVEDFHVGVRDIVRAAAIHLGGIMVQLGASIAASRSKRHLVVVGTELAAIAAPAIAHNHSRADAIRRGLQRRVVIVEAEHEVGVDQMHKEKEVVGLEVELLDVAARDAFGDETLRLVASRVSMVHLGASRLNRRTSSSPLPILMHSVLSGSSSSSPLKMLVASTWT